MNEQHIDALPPVQDPSADTAAPVGPPQAVPAGIPTPTSPASGPTGGFVDSQPTAPASQAPPAPTNAARPVPATPQIADDIDLIEKEWVSKAKQIVEQTKHDPYQQNEAMTQVKADYIKKRYNRELKTGEA